MLQRIALETEVIADSTNNTAGKQPVSQKTNPTIPTIDDLAKLANYSLIDTLNRDPDAKENGADHVPRQVFTGHYVPVKPTPIQNPEYVAHSKNLFHELGFAENIAPVSYTHLTLPTKA